MAAKPPSMLGGQPPVLRQQQPMDMSRDIGGMDPASIILKAAGLDREDAALQQKASEGMRNALFTVADLMHKKDALRVQEAENKATLELKEAMFAMRERGRDVDDNRQIVSMQEAMQYEQEYGIDANRLVGLPRAAARNLLPVQYFDPNNPTSPPMRGPAGGKNLQLPGAGKALEQAQSMAKARSLLASLKEKYNTVEEEGNTGPVQGRVANVVGRLSGGKFFTNAEDLRRSVQSNATTLRAQFNDSGAPSNFDVARFTEALVDASSDPKLAASRFAELERMLESGEASLLSTYPTLAPKIQEALRSAGAVKSKKAAAEDDEDAPVDYAALLLEKQKRLKKKK